ncbi:predicted protein [Sclerotinia sclerotiorum 1980 UF-70]|uniref:Uncharacterized protein n=1 Tax=Sclerotinia sclerotiorum (strain ATCC 18683 / 1980 / Ss-1) TaxID=665079 RepID=A7EKB5_SCLS1|nr:predicted protein [Sclerotinia sclerotiorum 1980 UF-70]EDO03281.1 predicted protein [Sclerotinia sclerotiorum 1980 UF-70]
MTPRYSMEKKALLAQSIKTEVATWLMTSVVTSPHPQNEKDVSQLQSPFSTQPRKLNLPLTTANNSTPSNLYNALQ